MAEFVAIYTERRIPLIGQRLKFKHEMWQQLRL